MTIYLRGLQFFLNNRPSVGTLIEYRPLPIILSLSENIILLLK